MMNKVHPVISISLILLLALTVRIYHYHHYLMSDEAQNMLTIKALIEGEGFREYFFKHPPFFTLLSAAVCYPVGDNYRVAQGISIVFSIISFIPFYLIVERLYERRAAILALLVLAIVPVNIIYSTWIKQDAMLLFFFVWSLYLYITERPGKSGLLFGIALLTKEFALFMIPIVIGWEVLKGWNGKETVKRFLAWLLTGTVLSAWWYVIYGGMSFKAIRDAIIGGNLFEYTWHYPWHYYFRNLEEDLGIMLIPLVIIGLLSAKKRVEFFPHLWILSFYVPLSAMTVKAPWYTYLASPAIAIIASIGFLKGWNVIANRWLKSCLTISIVFASLYSAYTLNAIGLFGYFAPQKPTLIPAFYEDEYLDAGREILKGNYKIAIIDYNPNLQYLLGISDKRIVYLGLQFPAMDKDALVGLVAANDIGLFAIDTSSAHFVNKNIDDLTDLWGEPKMVGSVLIFNTGAWNFPHAG